MLTSVDIYRLCSAAQSFYHQHFNYRLDFPVYLAGTVHCTRCLLNTHSLSLSLSLFLSHTHTLSLSLPHTHTHTLSLPLSFSLTHTLSLSLSLSHTHSLSH